MPPVTGKTALLRKVAAVPRRTKILKLNPMWSVLRLLGILCPIYLLSVLRNIVPDTAKESPL